MCNQTSFESAGLDPRSVTNLEFIIPIKIDFKDRVNNLNIVVNHIKNKYDFKINVIECDNFSKLNENKNYNKYFFEVKHEYFNRSYTINRLATFCESEYICICDSDIIFNYSKFDKALNLLKDYDFIFPFTGPIYNISINEYLKKTFTKNKTYSEFSNSGIFLCKRDSFLSCGMFNENFKGWGGEEEEFFYRITELNYKIGRINGPLFHLNHFRKDIFKYKNLIENNKKELQKIKKMNKSQLKKYYNLQ